MGDESTQVAQVRRRLSYELRPNGNFFWGSAKDNAVCSQPTIMIYTEEEAMLLIYIYSMLCTVLTT